MCRVHMCCVHMRRVRRERRAEGHHSAVPPPKPTDRSEFRSPPSASKAAWPRSPCPTSRCSTCRWWCRGPRTTSDRSSSRSRTYRCASSTCCPTASSPFAIVGETSTTGSHPERAAAASELSADTSGEIYNGRANNAALNRVLALKISALHDVGGTRRLRGGPGGPRPQLLRRGGRDRRTWLVSPAKSGRGTRARYSGEVLGRDIRAEHSGEARESNVGWYTDGRWMPRAGAELECRCTASRTLPSTMRNMDFSSARVTGTKALGVR